MAIEVLRPRDCLTNYTPAVFHRQKTTSVVERLSEQKKKLPPQQRRLPKRSAGYLVDKQHQDNNRNNTYNKNNHLVAGKVRIVRRGESLVSIKADEKNRDQETHVNSSKKLAGVIKNKVQVELQDRFAGYSVSESPSPRTLPVPSFLRKDVCALVS